MMMLRKLHIHIFSYLKWYQPEVCKPTKKDLNLFKPETGSEVAMQRISFCYCQLRPSPVKTFSMELIFTP